VELPVVRGVSFQVRWANAWCCPVLRRRQSSILKYDLRQLPLRRRRIGIRHEGAVIDLAGPSRARSQRPSATSATSASFLRAVPRVATLDVVAEP